MDITLISHTDHHIYHCLSFLNGLMATILKAAQIQSRLCDHFLTHSPGTGQVVRIVLILFPRMLTLPTVDAGNIKVSISNLGALPRSYELNAEISQCNSHGSLN